MDGYEELIIKSLITLIFAILSGFVIPYIKSKLNADKLAEIEKYTAWAVRTAEQLFKTGADKRQFVLEYITKKSEEIGLNLSSKDISNILEYTVNLIKYGQEYRR